LHISIDSCAFFPLPHAAHYHTLDETHTHTPAEDPRPSFGE